MKQHLFVISLLLTLSCAARAQETASTPPQPFKENSIGVGIGIPYGIIGVNGDLNIAPNLNFTLGIGTAVVSVGYNFGVKYFFLDADKWFRPRILAVYGTNSALQVTNASGYDKAYTGLSLGAGAQYMWSRTSGLDFDIIYIATTGLDVNDLRKQGIAADEPGKVKISLGYRYAF